MTMVVVMMANGLTRKQEKFVREYLIDLNATRAAERAGYSAKTVHVQGPRLLENVSVKRAIDEAIARRAKKFEVTQDRVIKELAKLAFTDIKDFLTFRTAKTVVDHDETGNPIISYAHIIDIKNSDEVDGAAIAEVQLQKDGTFKFKLHDKKGALELLGRHLGLFNDKLNLLADGLTINVNLVDGDEEEGGEESGAGYNKEGEEENGEGGD